MDKTPRSSRGSAAPSRGTEPGNRNSASGGAGDKPKTNEQPSIQARASVSSTRSSKPEPSPPVDAQTQGNGSQFVLRARRNLPASSSPSYSTITTGTSYIPTTTTTALVSGQPADNGLNNNVVTNSPPPQATTLADNRVFSTHLPQKILMIANAGQDQSAVLAPDKLAALIVAVESKGGSLALAGDRISGLLRGGLIIKEFMPSSGINKFDLNVVQECCEPFMARHLSVPEFEKTRKSLWKSYQKSLKSEPDQDKLHGAKQLSDADRALLAPTLKLIFGEHRTLESSRLPEAMKSLLLSIDREIIAWFKANGSGEQKDLYAARKNALIAYLSTRSLGFVWRNKLSAESPSNPVALKQAAALIQKLNSLVAAEADGFIHDLMLSQDSQPKAARNYVTLLGGNPPLKPKSSMRTLQPTERQTTSWERALSPRSLSHQGGEKVPHRTEAKRRHEHTKYAMQLLDALGIENIDAAFHKHLKEKLSQLGARGFDNVREDPIRYVTKYMDTFYPKSATPDQSKLIDKLKTALGSVNPKTHPSLFVARSEDSDQDEPRTSQLGSAPGTARSEESGSDSRADDVDAEKSGS